MKSPRRRTQVGRSDYRLILLGAGKPWRGNLPSAVQTVSQTRVLDWLLKAFKDMPAYFIGGYRFSEVTQKYPQLNATVNTEWEHTGSVASLLLAIDEGHPVIVSYTDIVIRPCVADNLLAAEGDVVLAVDTKWRERLEGQNTEAQHRMEFLNIENDLAVPLEKEATQVEFSGVMKLSAKATELFDKNRACIKEQYENKHLASLTEWFLFQKLDVRVVDVSGDWAELNTPQDLAQFLLGTKFETLNRLSGVLKLSHICDHIGVNIEHWNQGHKKVLQEAQQKFAGNKVIIRSSAFGEDSWAASMAGKYTSIADINADDEQALKQAIETVVSSYTDINPRDQILIEPYLSPVKVSGVIFTRSLKYRAPYYVINYDDQSQRTDTVTAGIDSPQKVFTLLRDHEPPVKCKEELKRLWAAVKEIEAVIGHDSLDIEFAITPDGKIYILQVRPLTAKEERWRGSYHDVQKRIKQAREHYNLSKAQASNLYGNQLIYGMMPDWNPAEIIGTRPTRLAESLYRYLVTDEIWAQQRAEYGYRDVRPHKLMRNIAGHAYIDVRASLNSFLPAYLDNKLQTKLANYYLARLKQNPHLHDKVEFDVAITCLALDFDQRGQVLQENGFTKEETDSLRAALAGINQNAITRYRQDMLTLGDLQSEAISSIDHDIPLEQAFLLLDTCKTKGVLPFAHLARAAFVAMTLLKTAVSKGIMSNEVLNHFLAGLHNVTSQLQQDARKVAEGKLSWESFVATYAHLRPGSYNITTPSYGDDPEYYLRPLVKNAGGQPKEEYDSTLPWDKLAVSCSEVGFLVEPAQLEDFVRNAIEGREKAKFIFMRHVNAALQIFRQYGVQHGMRPDEMTHLDITDLLGIADGHHIVGAGEFLKDTYMRNQLEHEICLGIELPELLTCGEDFIAFHSAKNHANFVGARAVSAKVVVLQEGQTEVSNLDDKIVAIMQADPGWDWIFGHNIAGLITAWGGANSHMAIRAAELDLPAAIGVGENQWQYYACANELYVNCATREIKVVM